MLYESQRTEEVICFLYLNDGVVVHVGPLIKVNDSQTYRFAMNR